MIFFNSVNKRVKIRLSTIEINILSIQNKILMINLVVSEFNIECSDVIFYFFHHIILCVNYN